MHTLEILDEYGFKFFPCRVDKTPDTPGSWQDPENHITLQQAQEYQYIGRIIGAWIPENIVVVDIDRHPGKPDGLESLNDISEKHHIPLDYIGTTLVCQTGGGGFHLLFTVEREFRQGVNKAPGIDLKTHKGYIIAPGSPGYKALNDFEPSPLPEQWEAWLDSCELENVPAVCDNRDDETFISSALLKNILKKVDVKNFRDNDRWLSFIMSALVTAGQDGSIFDVLEEWSSSDPDYSADRSIRNRISSFQTGIEKISRGSFVYFLKEEQVSNYLIKQVSTLDQAESIIEEGIKKAENLPFADPDYNLMCEMTEATELLTLRGNTAAATLLHRALVGNVIFVHGENKCYNFDGSKWVALYDYYNIVYTILFRLLNFLYAKLKTDQNKEDLADNFYKAVARLNDKSWKDCTWAELKVKERIMFESIQWDSPDIMETITCQDGVVDFTGSVVIERKGKREEFRKAFFEFPTSHVVEAGESIHFNNFMSDLFPDADTLKTAIYTTALSISGNPNKKRFQLFIGGNDNGKSTYVEIINKVLGRDLAYSFPASMLLQQRGMQSQLTPEMASFQGKRFLSSIETDEGTRFSVSKIKQLTGGDEISANPKYRDPITFMPTWQLTLAVNDLPTFSANDTAFINRLLIIPFKMTYWKNDIEHERALKSGKNPKYVSQAKDKNKMVNDILEEKPAVIKYMIDKYIELQHTLGGTIPESAECEQSKQGYIKDNDDMGIFLDNCCEIDYNDEHDWSTPSKIITEEFQIYVNNKKISQSYVTRAIKKRTNGTVYSDNALCEVTDERGITKKKRQKALINIRLKDTNVDEGDPSESENEIKSNGTKKVVDRNDGLTMDVTRAFGEKKLTDEEIAEKIPF